MSAIYRYVNNSIKIQHKHYERCSKQQTAATAAGNVTHIVDAVNENFTKLVNEAGKVQPQYAQAISNLAARIHRSGEEHHSENDFSWEAICKQQQ